LALLMDKVDGSGMENLGPTIFKHMHSLSWEVRDSVLELLHSIVEISNESESKLLILMKKVIFYFFPRISTIPEASDATQHLSNR
jgi:hypothetical protein